jgi:uncharacterized protein YwqG
MVRTSRSRNVPQRHLLTNSRVILEPDTCDPNLIKHQTRVGLQLFRSGHAPDHQSDSMAITNAALRLKFKKFARSAWQPVTEPCGPDEGISRYSGRPLLKTAESWPVCGDCDRPLQLFLQLDLSTIPEAAQQRLGLASGILQFFYCTHSDGTQGADWAPFSKAHFVRVLPGDASEYATAPATPEWPAKPAYLPANAITGWTLFEDFPSPEEEDELGMPEMSDTEYDAYYMSEPYLNAEGDKLCGWPNWVQDAEYPDCPECGRQMQMVYQLGSNSVLNWMWGDAGIGHITQCPEHRSMLAFGWACS